mmetsp:Transcript_23310/g.49672  ORF Transcript_23310/g.49672 Transcript_23310/m.49672 type:complete len:341 (-) Transcript_23310:306-1328(-)
MVGHLPRDLSRASNEAETRRNPNFHGNHGLHRRRVPLGNPHPHGRTQEGKCQIHRGRARQGPAAEAEAAEAEEQEEGEEDEAEGESEAEAGEAGEAGGAGGVTGGVGAGSCEEGEREVRRGVRGELEGVVEGEDKAAADEGRKEAEGLASVASPASVTPSTSNEPEPEPGDQWSKSGPRKARKKASVPLPTETEAEGPRRSKRITDLKERAQQRAREGGGGGPNSLYAKRYHENIVEVTETRRKLESKAKERCPFARSSRPWKVLQGDDPFGNIEIPLLVNEESAAQICCEGCKDWLHVHEEVIAAYANTKGLAFLCSYLTGRPCRSGQTQNKFNRRRGG